MNNRELPPDLKIALRVWWAYTWRFAVFFIVPAMLVLPFALFILRPPAAIRQLTSVGVFLYMIWLQVEIFRRILSMDFGRFQVRVLEPPE